MPANSPPMKILVVDDEPLLVQALSALLEEMGMEVVAFSKSADALQEVRQHEFGLILSDNMMPGMTGVELLTQAKQLWPNSRRVLITGSTDMGDAVDAFNGGVIHRFFQKPWKRSDLQSVIDEELRIYQGRADELAKMNELQDTLIRRTALLGDAAEFIRKTESLLMRTNEDKPPERHLSVILVGDVVGYSALMSRSDEQTLSVLTAYRALMEQLVREASGRLVNAVGDSILVEFGSTVDAMQFALKAQRDMAEANSRQPAEMQLIFRFGITIGDVLLKDGDLYGNGVNTAARLQALADPGGVCISAAAYEQVRSLLPIDVESMGEQQLKNIPSPVLVYRVKM
jgi:class 3 adenylate cyclase